LRSNSFVPLLLAEATRLNKIKLIHISTCCLFHFDFLHSKPISEDTLPDYFDTLHARSKIYSELPLARLASQQDILILRIRVPLDDKPHPKNILTKLINFTHVSDIPGSVTYLPNFVQALRQLIKIDARGLYNVVNRGTLRYPEILRIYQQYFPDHQFQTVHKVNLKRANVIMSCRKLISTGFPMPDIHFVLNSCVKRYCQFLKGKN
jgi:dTDP-4-dehydrorhamnose reductase